MGSPPQNTARCFGVMTRATTIRIMPKRDKRILSTRTCGRHVRGEQRDEHGQRGDRAERRCIQRGQFEKHALQVPGDRSGAERPDHRTDTG
jgi:hypothetical protein